MIGNRITEEIKCDDKEKSGRMKRAGTECRHKTHGSKGVDRRYLREQRNDVEKKRRSRTS